MLVIISLELNPVREINWSPGLVTYEPPFVEYRITACEQIRGPLLEVK